MVYGRQWSTKHRENKQRPIDANKKWHLQIGLAERSLRSIDASETELRDSLLTTTVDASLRRLFPTAYHNDAKKDAEYQRLMREELLASRLSSI